MLRKQHRIAVAKNKHTTQFMRDSNQELNELNRAMIKLRVENQDLHDLATMMTGTIHGKQQPKQAEDLRTFGSPRHFSASAR